MTETISINGVRDALGRLVIRTDAISDRVDISALSSGNYVIKVEGRAATFVKV